MSEPMDEEVSVPTVEGSENVAKFSLNILAFIKEAQMQHGLRHGDYERYRQYCSRRLHRIRTSLSFMCGKHKYVGQSLTVEDVSDERHLLIPLMQTERCWAYAQQLKLEAKAEDFNPRKLQHMRARLAKAVKYAAQLETLANSDRWEPRTGLEAKAYAAWIQGTHALELEQWQMALQNFNLAKVIYSELGSTLSEEARAIYTRRVDNVEPHIRYCTHTLGLSTKDISNLVLVSDDMLVAKIEMVREQEHAKKAATLREVQWYSRVVPVPSERLMTIILRAQEKRASLEGSQATATDRLQLSDKLLSDFQDARDQLQKEKNAVQTGNKKGPVIPAPQLQLLQSYLDYERLSVLNEKYSLMIEVGRENGKVEEIVGLHDAITLCLGEMQSLNEVVEDEVLSQEITMALAVNAALRLYSVAQAYLAVGKGVEAAALAKSVLETKLPMAIASCQGTGPAAEKARARLQDLSKDCRKLKCIAVATMALPGESNQGTGNVKEISLIDLPPKMEPVACKPLFFDLALSAMPLPDLAGQSQ
eukprot:Ihof_evm2s333 gene=Ihof_evmTU2s333